MPSPTPPSWIQIQRGTSPLVLLAPHGGRRVVARQPGQHKVNDLHTADVAEALAARTGATTIVNGIRDRNELDLNRIAQVREHAPWLPTLLAEVLEHEVARAGHVTLLVIHGWNIGQPACDVGIGLVERAGTLEAARTGAPTVSRRFLEETLPKLQLGAEAAGIAVTVGARYPAAHPNNLMQLFTAAYAQDPDPAIRRLGTLAAAGQLDAAQLELGIPLRWPGTMRERVIDVLVGTLHDVPHADAAASSRPPIPNRLACRGRVTERRALQFVHEDLFGLSAIEIGEAGSVGGRLLLSTAAGTVTLFTGELGDRTGPRWHIPPLRYEEDGTRWRLHFRGDVLTFGSLEPFLDLENGLADGRLMDADVALEFRARNGAIRAGESSPSRVAFGDLTGRVKVGDRASSIQTIALRTDGAGAPTRGLPALRVVLPQTAFGSVALASLSGDVHNGELRFALAGHADIGPHREDVTGTAMLRIEGPVATLVARVGTRELVGRVERLIPIRRPGRPGMILHTTYGLCHLGAPDGTGWLELATEHEIPLTPREA